MLADFAGITTPVMVVLNMMDVAAQQKNKLIVMQSHRNLMFL